MNMKAGRLHLHADICGDMGGVWQAAHPCRDLSLDWQALPSMAETPSGRRPETAPKSGA